VIDFIDQGAEGMGQERRPRGPSRNRRLGLGFALLLLLVSLVSSAVAQASPECEAPRLSLSALERVPQGPGWFDSLLQPGPQPTRGIPCLALLSPPTQQPQPTKEIFQISHTLSDLIRFEEQAQGESLPQERDLRLRLSDGLEVLARHLDLRTTLVKMLLDSQEIPYPQALLPDPQEELVFRFGDVASLAAKLDFMASLMQYLVQSLTASQIPLPPTEDEVTLVFNLKGGRTALDISAVLRGSTLLHDRDLSPQNQLDIRQITVTISNGTITSEAQLDPADLTLTRGQVEVKFKLGPNSITSTTVFTKGEGLKKEVLVLTAKLGALNLTGRATFGSELQEFKLEASLAGLAFSTLLTPKGLSQPTFGFELHF